VQYINSWRDLTEIQEAIDKRYLKCHNRIQFYTHYNVFMRLFAQNKLVKYTLGAEYLSMGKDHASDMESISRGKLSELDEAYSGFKDTVKVVETTLIN
jgi:hypothetical protein